MEISSTLGRRSKSPSSDYGAERRPLELSTARDFVARSAAARPKKLAPLAKKLMRSTYGKSTRWDVSTFSGVFKWEWETKLHLFVYTFPLLFPFRLVVGESDDVKRFLIMSWSDSHSPL